MKTIAIPTSNYTLAIDILWARQNVLITKVLLTVPPFVISVKESRSTNDKR